MVDRAIVTDHRRGGARRGHELSTSASIDRSAPSLPFEGVDRAIPDGGGPTTDETFDGDGPTIDARLAANANGNGNGNGNGDERRPAAGTSTARHRRASGRSGQELIGGQTFTEFYSEFKPRLAQYAARKRAEDPEGTADLALFDLHRALRRGPFESGAAARAYAYRAVRSRAAGEFRKAVPVPVPFDEEDLADRVDDDEGQAVVDRDAAAQLLAGLNDAQREVVEGRYLDDLTAEEVGRQTDRSPEAVYQLQRRGLANLRRVAPTILLVVLILVGGLVFLALNRQGPTVTTDPIDGPVERSPDVAEDSEESSGVGQSGIGIVTEDGLVVAGTGPGEPLDGDAGPVAPEPTSGPAPDQVEIADPSTTLEPGTTTSSPTTASSSTTANPGPDAPPETLPDVLPETSTTTPATTLAPFDGLIDQRQVARLRFEHSGLCLDAPGDSVGSVVVQRPCQAGGTQDIELVPRRGGNAARVVHSRLCLGPQGNALVEGAVIVQQQCTGQPWQVFEIPGGALKFWDEDLCYAVEDDSTAEGARLVLARCTEGPTQRFSGA